MVKNKQITIDDRIIEPPKLRIKKTTCIYCGERYRDIKKHYNNCEERQKSVKKNKKDQKNIIDFSEQIDRQSIEIALIRPNSWNVNSMSQKEYEKLKESIRITKGEHLKKNPIQIREIEKGKYETIDGEHRCRAFEELGYTHIPAIIEREVDIEEAKVLNVIHNINRGKIDYFKLSKLLNEEYKDENGKKKCTQPQLAVRFGLSSKQRVSDILLIYPRLKLFHNKSPHMRTLEKSILESLARCKNDLLREKLIEQSIKNEWTSEDIRIQATKINRIFKFLDREFNQKTKKCILTQYSGNSIFELSYNQIIEKFFNQFIDNDRKDVIIKYMRDFVLHSNIAKEFKEKYVKENKTYTDWYHTFRGTPMGRSASKMTWDFFMEYHNGKVYCWDCKKEIENFNNYTDHHEEYEFRDDMLFFIFPEGDQKIFPSHNNKKCHQKGNSKNWNKND